MKVKCYFSNMVKHRTTGWFTFYILPSLEIDKNDVFNEGYFEICFKWLCWVFIISINKKGDT